MSGRLVRTKQTIWMSDNGRVRLERQGVTVPRRFRRGYWTRRKAWFLTIKFGEGAGYQRDGKRGRTLRVGTRVRAYRYRGGYPRVAWLRAEFTTNGNPPKPFYPAWY